MPPSPFAWVFQLAGVIGLSPRDVRRATLPELLLMLEGWRISTGRTLERMPDPMSRAALGDLLRRYPDQISD